MSKLPLNRRQMIAATAATGTALTASSVAHAVDDAKPDLTGKSILTTGSSSGFGYLGAIY
jgi:hypothetical protein